MGQPDFVTTTTPYITQERIDHHHAFHYPERISNPTGVASDGNILVVADNTNKTAF